MKMISRAHLLNPKAYKHLTPTAKGLNHQGYRDRTINNKLFGTFS